MASRTVPSELNAAQITESLERASAAIASAQKNLRDAVAAIESGEVEAELKTPVLKHIQGTLALAQSATALESSSWLQFQRARARRD